MIFKLLTGFNLNKALVRYNKQNLSRQHKRYIIEIIQGCFSGEAIGILDKIVSNSDGKKVLKDFFNSYNQYFYVSYRLALWSSKHELELDKSIIKHTVGECVRRGKIFYLNWLYLNYNLNSNDLIDWNNILDVAYQYQLYSIIRWIKYNQKERKKPLLKKLLDLGSKNGYDVVFDEILSYVDIGFVLDKQLYLYQKLIK